MSGSSKIWAVVPAAGVGRRLGSVIPKQYLKLADRKVIEITLARLLEHKQMAGVIVALSEEDEWWPETCYADHAKVTVVPGGAERCDSVLNGLTHLLTQADSEDWVLVHDAARPCLREADLTLLIDTLIGHPEGGLLGVPVHDTIKRTDEACRVNETVSRDALWHAYTPQMFRLGLLHQALLDARAEGYQVTDDASAMELAGYNPLMVEGHADNIKITRPEDLALAEFYLSNQRL